MTDAHKLLNLFYRLHFALRVGVFPENGGYGNRAEEIAAGKMPKGDIYDDRHVYIYSTVLNLRIAYPDDRSGGFVRVYVGVDLDDKWEVNLNWSALGAMSADDAKPHSEDLVYAVKVAKICEEIIAEPLDFDVRDARQVLDDAIKASWEEVGKGGNPKDALAGAWRRLNA